MWVESEQNRSQDDMVFRRPNTETAFGGEMIEFIILLPPKCWHAAILTPIIFTRWDLSLSRLCYRLISFVFLKLSSRDKLSHQIVTGTYHSKDHLWLSRGPVAKGIHLFRSKVPYYVTSSPGASPMKVRHSRPQMTRVLWFYFYFALQPPSTHALYQERPAAILSSWSKNP